MKKYDELIAQLQQNGDKDFVCLLNDLRCGFISDVSLIEKEKNIHNILDKKENLEIIKNVLELIYEERKSQLTADEDISNLTKKYHKDLSFVDGLYEDLIIAKGVRDIDASIMSDFTKNLDFAKKISEHPNWYLEEGIDPINIAAPLRSFAEIHLCDRISERSIDKEWDYLGVAWDDMRDKSKTKKAIETMYESLGLDSKIKDLSEDYFESPQKLAERIDMGKVSLQEVLYQVELNLLLNESNIEPLSYILGTKYGEEILSYINLHADVHTSKQFEDIYNYIHNNEIGDSLRVNSSISTLTSLLDVKEKMY